jgi:hypothetical protein
VTYPGLLPKKTGPYTPTWGSAPRGSLYAVFFFFQKKKQKALVLLRRRSSLTQTSAKPTLVVWGRAPSKTLYVMFFIFWPAKSVVLLRRKLSLTLNLGEADLGVLERALRNNSRYKI